MDLLLTIFKKILMIYCNYQLAAAFISWISGGSPSTEFLGSQPVRNWSLRMKYSEQTKNLQTVNLQPDGRQLLNGSKLCLEVET